MKARGAYSRRAAWIAIFALLLQAILPALHHPVTMAFGGDNPLDVAHHLCLAQGSTTGDPVDQDKPPQHHQMPDCALCQAVHAIGGFAPPVAPVVARAFSPATTVQYALAPLSTLRRSVTPGQPRGPPVSA